MAGGSGDMVDGKLTPKGAPAGRIKGTTGVVILLAGISAFAGCGSGDSDARSTPTVAKTATTATAPRPTDQSEPGTSRTTVPATTLAPAPVRAPDAVPAAPLAGRTIVVDPGHNRLNGAHTREINRLVDAGGFQKACNTTGTAGNDGWPEATFTWLEAGELRSALEAEGARVVLTRPDNDGWGPCIDARGLTAEREHADALVSLHADGASGASHGFHVIHPAETHATTEVVEPSDGLAHLVRDHLVAAGLSPADYIGQDGLDQRDDLGTLNRAGRPAVMLELGNMRNASDLAALQDPTWRTRVARAIASAIEEFVTTGRDHG